MISSFDLTGRTAVVTGGGRGLGLGISRALLNAGADVVVLSRSALDDRLRRTAADLGRSVSHVGVDLRDREGVAAAGAEVLAGHQVDILRLAEWERQVPALTHAGQAPPVAPR